MSFTLNRGELKLLAFIHSLSTGCDKSSGLSPFRVRQGVGIGEKELDGAIEHLRLLGLIGTGGTTISPFGGERIENVYLTSKGRELLWLLENALSLPDMTAHVIATFYDAARSEVDRTVEEFLVKH